MSHPFGDLLSQYLHRKHGLSQSRLAAGILQEPAIITRMCKGERLTGPQARERVMAIINWMWAQGALTNVNEANALLDAAGMAPLRAQDATEAMLIVKLQSSSPQTSSTRRTTSNSSRHNLPQQLTSFIGRADEISTIEKLLLEKRMVTLTGSGGVGKTRLAIEVGMRMLHAFPDGVWLIDLAQVADPVLVARAVCATFDLPERIERPDLRMATNFLEQKQLLLILDNCEHLIVACAELAEHVLRACSHVSVLATSRESLHIPGESSWRVPSLTTPESMTALSLSDLLQYEAIRLFVERTHDTQPGHKLTSFQSAAIVEVCRRLDGIPLALEMAAAHTNAMTVAEIAARLDDRFGMLTNGARTALPRHRTLRAMLDWSYELLSPAEQRLLARLSVFAGGWTSEAAEAINPDADALTLLVRLVHTSLVVAEPRDGRTRYRLLEMVRQFAFEKLDSFGEVEMTRRRHCDYFTAQGEAFEPTMIGPRLKAWCGQVTADWNNIRAAVDWARSQADGGVRLARIAGSLFHYWMRRGIGREFTAWLEEAIQRTQEEDGLPRARALITFARTKEYWLYNDRPIERAMVDEGLRISRQKNDKTGIAYALLLRGGFVDFRSGNSHDRLAPVEQSLCMFREAGQDLGVGDALRMLALTHMNLGNKASAAKTLEETGVWCYETGETLCLYNALNYLAAFNAPRAIELGELVLTKHRAQGEAEDIAASLQVLGRIHLKVGNYTEAKEILEECHAQWQALGRLWSGPGGTARSLWDLGAVLGLLGDYDRAAAMLSQAQAEYDFAGDEHGVAWALYFRGQVQVMNGDMVSAEQVLSESARHLHTQGDLAGAALALCKLGEIALTRGDSQRAMPLLGAAMSREPNAHVHDLPPPWRESHLQTIADARALINELALDAAWIDGQDIGQVIARYLLSEKA